MKRACLINTKKDENILRVFLRRALRGSSDLIKLKYLRMKILKSISVFAMLFWALQVVSVAQVTESERRNAVEKESPATKVMQIEKRETAPAATALEAVKVEEHAKDRAVERKTCCEGKNCTNENCTCKTKKKDFKHKKAHPCKHTGIEKSKGHHHRHTQ